MKPIRKIKDFKQREDGSLLIFFVVSIVAILGIMALSFDMGRRASTQSDMQSFADNVALAAAGELDGQPDAITRATTAAQNAIVAANEQLKAGASGSATTLRIASTALGDPVDGLVFYSSLPANDSPGNYTVASLSATKYDLPAAGVTTEPTEAAFVGVRLSEVPVDWMFGNIFGSNLSISTDIGAVAVAGNSAFTCDIAPVMFCLPMQSNGSGGQIPKTLTAGQAVQLRSVGRNAQWNPGQFGFLDIDRLIASDPNAAAGECASMSPESRRQACLLAKGINACFNSRNVDIQPGQRTGQETAGFNLSFGMFEQVMNQLRGQPGYEVGPHVVAGRDVNNNCRDTGASADTVAFPLDDCHYTSSCADGRFGNGNWTNGRADYLDTNYTHQTPSGTVVQPGSFFDFPESLTRYEYYLREIERAANGGVMSQYAGAQYNADQTPGVQYDTWDDYWGNPPANGFNPIIPNPQNRSEDGLPQCSQAGEGAGPDRRVLIVAGIDCVNQTLTGSEQNVPVAQYYRTFMLSPATEISNSPSQGQMFDLWVEIIEPVGGEAGASTLDNGIFREVIQLYK